MMVLQGENSLSGAEITSGKVAPNSTNMTWTLTPLDGQGSSNNLGGLAVRTGEEGKYQISIPVTITEAGKYKLFVEFEGISAQKCCKYK